MNKKINSLVIVESPTKANTIKNFLPSGFIVKASIGHIRDLPKKASEIPSSKKDKSWSNSKNLGIDIENNFESLYIIPKTKSKIVNELKAELKKADELFLATDEDREGESISYHLLEVLKPKIPVKRMVFHEITKNAILESLKNTRDVNFNLVNAQETRRAMDRLFGFTVSSLIWEKIAYGLSAGRVQSPALKMIVERERERMLFVNSKYYDVAVKLEKNKIDFDSAIIYHKGQRIASSRDFSSDGEKKSDKVLYLSKEEAEKIEKSLKNKKFIIKELIEKTVYLNPPRPYITSTLQQDSSRQYSFSAKKTMKIAQQLYEKGYITYMRTDSYNLSKEAISEAEKEILKHYGAEYLKDTKSKSENKKSPHSQEAHEAIRPSKEKFIHPSQITGLDIDEFKLFSIIYRRTLASLMKKAQRTSVLAKIKAGESLFQSNFLYTIFDGFNRAYTDIKKEDVDKLKLKQDEECNFLDSKLLEHETKAPSRYTEASLIQRLEKEGIGRPSTYASILTTLIERKYISKLQGSLIPSYIGFAVSSFMENNFSKYVDYKFTSDLENNLDKISLGKFDKIKYLNDFYLGENGLLKKTEEGKSKIDANECRSVYLPQLKKNQEIKIGKYGAYLVLDGDEHISIPEDTFPFELSQEKIESIKKTSLESDKPLFVNEKQEDVFIKNGRYGQYLEIKKGEELLRRITLPKNINEEKMNREYLESLSLLPKKLAELDGVDIVLNLGAYGFYLKMDSLNCSLRNRDWTTIDEKEAVELIIKEKERKEKMLFKDFGKILGKETKILISKRGLYIRHGILNLSIPKEYKDKAEDIDEKILETIIKNSKKNKK